MKTHIPNNSDLKLHELHNKKLEEIHTNQLGLKIPDNYFSDSKKIILDKILTKEKETSLPIYRNKITWYIAASIVLLFGITFMNNYSNISSRNKEIVFEDSINKLKKDLEHGAVTVINTNSQPKPEDLITIEITTDNSDNQNFMLEKYENDIMIKSLFIDDDEVNESVTNYMLEDI